MNKILIFTLLLIILAGGFLLNVLVGGWAYSFVALIITWIILESSYNMGMWK